MRRCRKCRVIARLNHHRTRATQAPLSNQQSLRHPSRRKKSPPFPQNRHRAHKAKREARSNKQMRSRRHKIRRASRNRNRGRMRQRPLQAEIAKTKSLQPRISPSAESRRHQCPPPPRLQHRLPAKSAAPRTRRHAPKKIRNRPPCKKENRNPDCHQPAGRKKGKKNFRQSDRPKYRTAPPAPSRGSCAAPDNRRAHPARSRQQSAPTPQNPPPHSPRPREKSHRRKGSRHSRSRNLIRRHRRLLAAKVGPQERTANSHRSRRASRGPRASNGTPPAIHGTHRKPYCDKGLQ